MSNTANPQGTNKAAAQGQAAAEGREGNGRFAIGNKGGPGNPFGRLTTALKKAFLENVGPEEMGQIVKALIEKAKEGDVAAAKIVIQYTIGKPTSMEELMAVGEQFVDEAPVKATRASGLGGNFRDSERGITYESLLDAKMDLTEPVSALGFGSEPGKCKAAPSGNGGNGGAGCAGKGGGGRK